jgi:hypothetical protein
MNLNPKLSDWKGHTCCWELAEEKTDFVDILYFTFATTTI